ncbi:MAG TPA: SMP-30/gluconolactonase/LRE family protein [Conexibacter sp.]|jgi:sugar lactone lactonase YvrE|nr:SMP-30/gluconolactonase/LRE family protein [Conexibacter sp.]
MTLPEIRIALDARDRLGEGPGWDDERGELVRVDITGSRVHGWSPESGPTWSIEVEGEVGAAVLRKDGGLVLAIDHALVLRDPDGSERVLATAEEDKDENRFNDCRADPQGRLWAGTMSRVRTPGAAALYRLEPGGELEQVLDGTAISNGIGWSPDGETMYFVDSPSQKLDALDFDPATGAISNRRTIAEVDPADGLPDGLTIDAEGGVWVALFAGGALRRYAPDGTLEAHVELPLTNPTCPAFGGPELETLYLTTAWHKLTPEQHAAEPLAGALLAFEPGVRGLPRHRFGG